MEGLVEEDETEAPDDALAPGMLAALALPQVEPAETPILPAFFPITC